MLFEILPDKDYTMFYILPLPSIFVHRRVKFPNNWPPIVLTLKNYKLRLLINITIESVPIFIKTFERYLSTNVSV